MIFASWILGSREKQKMECNKSYHDFKAFKKFDIPGANQSYKWAAKQKPCYTSFARIDTIQKTLI